MIHYSKIAVRGLIVMMGSSIQSIIQSIMSISAPAISDFSQYFQQFNTIFEADQNKRDEIQQQIKLLNVANRKLTAQLNLIHSQAAQSQHKLTRIANNALKEFDSCEMSWKELNRIMNGSEVAQYHSSYSYLLQSFISQAVLIQFLLDQQLPNIQQCQTIIKLTQHAEEDKASNNIKVDVEDYLLGLTLVPKELSRLAVNSVRYGNYSTPALISTYLNNLYSGFRVLNLRNDALRRRYDGIKYEIQKIEEVLYDVTIRKLSTSRDNSDININNNPHNSLDEEMK
jgi:predicted translin family RNA/ssDNA-binding protein